MKTKDLTGRAFEQAVFAIQKKMDTTSTVTHDEKLTDRVGNKRQYEVGMRGQLGGRELLGVLECKDNSRKKGPDAVEAFAKKTENLGANFKCIVSRRGFTDQALKLAKHEGIGCLSLLPDDPMQAGFSIGDTWYATNYCWVNTRLTIHFPPGVTHPPDFQPRSVMQNGQAILHWLAKEYGTTYGMEERIGTLKVAVVFNVVQTVDIEGKTIQRG